ncbi:MAG: YdiU family protein [Candidatus Dadabacteria bacterium]|nr:YdiU family protein [Candidatus Dadabacteria bacterium]
MKRITELDFDNTYRRLPGDFYDAVRPTPLINPGLVSFNPDAAALIDLDPEEASNPELPLYLSGGKAIPGSNPVALYYTGHQFGVYNPDIGDGRAILLGEVRNSRGGKWDLHLKGAGRTAYARVFDGRAVLRSVIREYLSSEAMHGLGIPTTRALSIVGSDEKVERETTERGAMLMRMAETHVRFGSFEGFHYTGRVDYVKLLADYVIDGFFPHLAGEENRYASFLSEVVDRTAKLIALWQAYGFTHGVMNTDNMSIIGLTLDYGPFGFLEDYSPEYIPNHSDHFGRYSYGNQPAIALWNLQKLAEALGSVVPRELSQEIVFGFRGLYGKYYLGIMKRKLGLLKEDEDDPALIKSLLGILEECKADYTNFMRGLGDFSAETGVEKRHPAGMLEEPPLLKEWAASYRRRLVSEGSVHAERKEAMSSVNPKYILRNYLAERAIRKAEDEGDYSEIERLRVLLKTPFSEQPEFDEYSKPAPPSARGLVISCSS